MYSQANGHRNTRGNLLDAKKSTSDVSLFTDTALIYLLLSILSMHLCAHDGYLTYPVPLRIFGCACPQKIKSRRLQNAVKHMNSTPAVYQHVKESQQKTKLNNQWLYVFKRNHPKLLPLPLLLILY